MKLTEYLVSNPKKYIIFDLDDTLAHLNVDWSTYREEIFGVVAAFDEQLVKETPPFYYAGLELSNRAIQKHGKFAHNAVCRFTEEYELSHYSGYIPNKELLCFVRDNSKKYSFFIWTSNARKTIQDFLSKESLTTAFKTIVTRNDVDMVKPHREGFDRMYIQDTALSEYLLVGDSVMDEGAAKNIGIDFFKIDRLI